VTIPTLSILLEDQRLDARSFDLLSRLEVRESDFDPTVAVMRFRMAQRPGGEFGLIDEDVFEPARPLAVELASPGGLPVRIFDGYATHVRPHFEEIEANCYVEVIALDAAALLDAAERTDSYPDMSDREAAEAVFGRYGFATEGDDTPARATEAAQLLVQRGTDWAFVRKLARRNGFVCYFEYDPLLGQVVGHFRRPPIDEPPQADLTVLRENVNLTWIDLQLSMTGPVRHRGAAIDPLRKRMIRAEGDEILPALGAAGLAAAVEDGLVEAGADGAAALLRGTVPDDAALNAAAAGESDRARFVVEARGELDPALYRGVLRARRPVLIKGVGSRFSGTYYVRSVRTVLDQGKLTQTFIAVRNALGQSGQEAFGQSAEEVPAA
jgi:hypothetical protein